MNVNNISTNYNATHNNNPTPRHTSILKPLLYTYLTAMAIMPVETKDYFQKQEQLQEAKEKIQKKPFTNENDSYLKERFSPDKKNKNILYQLKMANIVDQAQMEKVSEDKFRYSIQIDDKKIKGKLKFVNEDRVVYGSAVINDLSKEVSKSKEFKFKILMPSKKSNSFLLKILDNTEASEAKQIFTLSRKNDGELVLNNGTENTVLNPKNTEVYQAIKDIERSLSDERDKISKKEEEQKGLQLILSVMFLFEFLMGITKERINQE